MTNLVHALIGFQPATYRSPEEEPDPSLRDNPMALAFPAPMSPEQLYNVLALDSPKRGVDFPERPLEVRAEALDRLDECYTPFPHDWDILSAVVSLVRKSFRYRHPNQPQVMYFIYQVASGVTGALPRLIPTGGGGALGMLISGPSGTGKSSLIDRIVEHLRPQARYHMSLFGERCIWPQLGVIRITVGLTWKDTLVELSKEIDRQLGRDVLFTRERHATEPRLQQVVWTALCSGFAPCIILDEFQRLGALKSNVARKILEKLLDLMQNSGIPVIVVGTVAVRKLFEMFPMEMGKFAAGDGYKFQRLTENDPNTLNYITVLKEQSISIAPIQYSEKFDRYLVLHSMGVRRVMRDFMRWVFHRHAVAESQGWALTADEALLQDIATSEMLVWQQALSAIRKYELGFGTSSGQMQTYEHFFPHQPEKRQTNAQKYTEAMWKAEGQVSPYEDLRLLGVEDFLFLRSQLLLRQYEESAEKAQVEAANCAGEVCNPDRQVEPEQRSGLNKERKVGGSRAKKSSHTKEPADPRSNVVPLALVGRPPVQPQFGVDPTNLPD